MTTTTTSPKAPRPAPLPAPLVLEGTPATMGCGSDCYPYEVIKGNATPGRLGLVTTGKTLFLRRLAHKVVSGSGYDGSAKYEYSSDPTGDILEAKWRVVPKTKGKMYAWTTEGGRRVHIGSARYYRDPHF